MTDPYYADKWRTLYYSDALAVLTELESASIDLLCTDPPYGISFMGKDWDKALPDKRIWAECLRVLKPGAFAFVMSIPRSDCLSRMIISLEDAGFRVDFTPIYWTYASGFPKAMSISKAVDKRLGAERKGIIKTDGVGSDAGSGRYNWNDGQSKMATEYETGCAETSQAKALDGSYGGFQPKPAVEVIIVAMKPLSEKTFVDQALKNGKGITWLDDCRIPYESEGDKTIVPQPITNSPTGMTYGFKTGTGRSGEMFNPQSGRFPANLLCSDDVLNDGEITKSGKNAVRRQEGMFVDHHLGGVGNPQVYHPDSGSFSRYFDLDKWWTKTFPFLITPKASKSEKNKGLEDIEPIQTNDGRNKLPDNAFQRGKTYRTNSHPTVKPLKLMAYLITLGSREGDIVLDPYLGSGTTALAAGQLNRKSIGLEVSADYCEIAVNRCAADTIDRIQRGDY